ncbi:MAG: ABC transporter ATP-binding protein/permease [Clostridia bacterium]|nr:ABC transporter ATP-binding protein/permease [Clostridia bacterium]
MKQAKRRSAPMIMGALIGLVKPLLPVMCLAILLGVIGYLCAIFLTILAGYGLLHALLDAIGAAAPSGVLSVPMGRIFILLICLAVCRGLLHYGEQYCNHFIAFKLLAIIRNKVFTALRRLCPAKLEGRDKGNLISILTSDIELLEVFYAHTISPIAIAVCTCIIMVIFIGSNSVAGGMLALAGYVVVGAVIPIVMGRKGAAPGMKLRNAFGDLNSFVLDSLRGLDETIQYDDGAQRMQQMNDRSAAYGRLQKELNQLEAVQRSITDLAILLFSLAMLLMLLHFYLAETASFEQMLICVIAMMGSFGPVVALSNLSNNLNQTLASGERVLAILEEEPKVEEVYNGKNTEFFGAETQNISFSYEKEQILKNYSISLPKGKIVGIHGVSGSGKSTLLRLLMRFWDVQEGSVAISGEDIRELNTANLRDMESYVTQETYLFHDSIANNIAIGKPGATREEIIKAAKQASVHDFIQSLPKGYDTPVGELGDTLSSGERQRIGIARAFLHDAPFLLLDEPTSNLDSLNEGIVLKSLRETCHDKTVVLVSHRKSTMHVTDISYEMDQGRLS